MDATNLLISQIHLGTSDYQISSLALVKDVCWLHYWLSKPGFRGNGQYQITVKLNTYFVLFRGSYTDMFISPRVFPHTDTTPRCDGAGPHPAGCNTPTCAPRSQ